MVLCGPPRCGVDSGQNLILIVPFDVVHVGDRLRLREPEIAGRSGEQMRGEEQGEGKEENTQRRPLVPYGRAATSNHCNLVEAARVERTRFRH